MESCDRREATTVSNPFPNSGVTTGRRPKDVQGHEESPVIPRIVVQHADEAAALYLHRRNMVCARCQIEELRGLDDRIAAHLDGLVVAGDEGLRYCGDTLLASSEEAAFVSGFMAISLRHHDRIGHMAAIAEDHGPIMDGLTSALGWPEASALEGLVSPLLASSQAACRAVGIAACGIHRRDPGAALQGTRWRTPILWFARVLCGQRGDRSQRLNLGVQPWNRRRRSGVPPLGCVVNCAARR